MNKFIFVVKVMFFVGLAQFLYQKMRETLFFVFFVCVLDWVQAVSTFIDNRDYRCCTKVKKKGSKVKTKTQLKCVKNKKLH